MLSPMGREKTAKEKIRHRIRCEEYFWQKRAVGQKRTARERTIHESGKKGGACWRGGLFLGKVWESSLSKER